VASSHLASWHRGTVASSLRRVRLCLVAYLPRLCIVALSRYRRVEHWHRVWHRGIVAFGIVAPWHRGIESSSCKTMPRLVSALTLHRGIESASSRGIVMLNIGIVEHWHRVLASWHRRVWHRGTVALWHRVFVVLDSASSRICLDSASWH